MLLNDEFIILKKLNNNTISKEKFLSLLDILLNILKYKKISLKIWQKMIARLFSVIVNRYDLTDEELSLIINVKFNSSIKYYFLKYLYLSLNTSNIINQRIIYLINLIDKNRLNSSSLLYYENLINYIDNKRKTSSLNKRSRKIN